MSNNATGDEKWLFVLLMQQWGRNIEDAKDRELKKRTHITLFKQFYVTLHEEEMVVLGGMMTEVCPSRTIISHPLPFIICGDFFAGDSSVKSNMDHTNTRRD